MASGMATYRLQPKRDVGKVCTYMLVLARIPISLTVSVVSMLGYLLFSPSLSFNMLATGAGSFFLCAGCSAINQVQEKRTDAYFTRTVMRPLPQGLLSSKTALLAGIIWIGVAFSMYELAAARECVWLAMFVIATYNGIYTGLKRRTSLSLLIGSIAGAMPPLMGWVAAGGNVFDPLILSSCAIWYLVQIPHAWMRIDKYRDEYMSRFCPIPVSYFIFVYKRMLLRVWYFAFVCSLMFFVLISSWRWDFPTGTSAVLGVLFLIGGLIPMNRTRALYFFDVTALLVLFGTVLTRL